MKRFFLQVLLLCLLCLCAAASAGSATVTNIEKSQIDSVIAAEPALVVIDLRTEAEYAANALKGAININFYNADVEMKVQQLAAEKPNSAWLVYCRSGNRSGQALPVLQKWLPGTIYHLHRGIIQR